MLLSGRQTVIIGAGPAGLTAAYELCKHGHRPVILEADPIQVGGISQTATYKGNRFDIGGHRFFSKNQEVEQLWTEILGADMISVPRMSRILYRGRYFDYPLKALNAFTNLGLLETVHCVASYLWVQLFPRKPVVSFEDWVTNRFGSRLFQIFFKTYTEKVWGIPCGEISADWAAQRIKGLNLLTAALNALGFKARGEKTVKTLIDNFRYPRLGPGMMWERLAASLQEQGCLLHMGAAVDRLERQGQQLVVCAGDRQFLADRVISSMPLRTLMLALQPAPPDPVLAAAGRLGYRDFLTVVLIVDEKNLFPDNWIYIHDPNVQVGRIQNYKNWSPEMVANPDHTGLGLEYFCFEGDGLWTSRDEDLIALATRELAQLKMVRPERVVDGTVVRMPKAYPVYDDGYLDRVETVRRYLEQALPELQIVGRNGMHRYNNQDHAMLTGLLAARNLLGQGPFDLWRVNADAEYLEEDSVQERLVPRRLG